MEKKVDYWYGTHIHLSTLEKIAGRRFQKLRSAIGYVDKGIELSIRLPRYTWKKYHMEDAIKRAGLGNKNAIYVNL